MKLISHQVFTRWEKNQKLLQIISIYKNIFQRSRISQPILKSGLSLIVNEVIENDFHVYIPISLIN